MAQLVILINHRLCPIIQQTAKLVINGDSLCPLYGPFLLKLLVTVKIMYKKKFFKCEINVVKAVQVNISNAYMKLQSMN